MTTKRVGPPKKRRPRGITIKDKVYGLEAWARQMVLDMNNVRARLAKLEVAPPNERMMELLAREIVRQGKK